MGDSHWKMIAAAITNDKEDLGLDDESNALLRPLYEQYIADQDADLAELQDADCQTTDARCRQFVRFTQELT